MLATTPLFYAYDWPRRAVNYITCRQPGDNNATPTACSATDDTLAPAAAAAATDDGDDDVNADDAGRNTPATNSPSKVRS